MLLIPHRQDYYILMSFLICEKHNKFEKVGSKIPNNAYICMNRYCPQSFKVFCSSCKGEHRDHSIKILTIEDVSFLVDRLLKTPFKQVSRVMVQTLDIMKKLKLIKEFRKKIDILEKQIQKEALKLINQTQSLIQGYSNCEANVNILAEIFSSIQEIESYRQFLSRSTDLLSNLDYNFKKDKFEFGNGSIKQKQDKRKKTVEQAKRKIQEVRDYSMKIIEVILHNDDSQQQQENLVYQKKHYQILKGELSVDKNQKELDEQIFEIKNSNSTINKSRFKKESVSVQLQTTAQMISIQQSDQRFKNKMSEINISHIKQQNDYKLKLGVIAKQKQNLNRELIRFKQKYDDKKKRIGQIQNKLRQNKKQKADKIETRQQIINKIIQYSQIKMLNNDQKGD